MRYILAYTVRNEIEVRLMHGNQVVRFMHLNLFGFPEDIKTVEELSDYYYHNGEFEDYGTTLLTLTDENGVLILKLWYWNQQMKYFVGRQEE